MTPGWLAVVIAAVLVFFPVLGNCASRSRVIPAVDAPVRGKLGTSTPGAEEKLNTITHRPCRNQIDQLHELGYERTSPRSPCSNRFPGDRIANDPRGRVRLQLR